MKNMKKMKQKITALFMTLVMLLTMGAMTVLAAPQDGGTITVNGTTAGKTYDIYKIFDLTGQDTSEPADSTYDKVSYTIDSDWVAFFIGIDAPGAGYIVDTDSTNTLNSIVITNDDNTKTIKYINITDDNVKQFAQDALAWCADNTPLADKTADATGESLTFTDLPLGYYLVYPQGATDIDTVSGYGSICSLTSTVPNGTVNIKATYPEITKTVDDQSVEVGQTVTYTITGQVPDTTGYSAYTYEVKDTMSNGLTFNEDIAQLSVQFGSTDITSQVNDTSNSNATITYANNGFTLTFDMTKYQDYKGQTITITYKALVNDNAVVTLTKNSATLTYSKDPEHTDSTETTPPEVVEVYSSKIIIDKYDGADTSKTTKLADAKFVLVKKDGGIEKFYKYTSVSGDTPSKVDWVDSIDDATEVATDNNGTAEFAGLEDGTYYLRETDSPVGYNMLAEDVEVIVTHGTAPDPDSDLSIGVSVTSEIPNYSGTELPETGGIGTTIFYIIGAILLVGAAVLLITKRRMDANK